MSVQAAAAPTAANRPGDHLSPDGFDYNRIAGVRGNPHVTDAFIREVEAMAERLGTRPEYLLAVMSFETGGSFRPDVRNAAGSGATGLIQFMPGTAEGLGTSTDALARMSAVEQLEYVERYFNNRADRGDLNTLEGVYTTVLYGSPRPNPDSTLFSQGSAAYRMNSPLDINNDGRITAGEATSFVRARIDGDAPPPIDTPPTQPNPQPDPGNADGSYTVRRGDTLSGIAQRHGVSLSALLEANPQIRNPNLIYPGQSIHLPGGDGNNHQQPAGNYTVRSGDTLSGIAQRHDVSLNALLNANPQIDNPNLIYPGQNVRIPGGGDGNQQPAGNYTVRSGDTLSGIAQRHDVSLNALLNANPQIDNPNLIYPGQNVRIPGGGGDGNQQPAGNYTVRSGDTLSGIAQRHDVSLSALLNANPQIDNPNLIYPGQNVRIPGGGGGNPNPPGNDNPPNPPSGDTQVYSPYTVYSTGHRPAFAVDSADELQPHHDYQSQTRNGQTLEVRDIVLHRNGQSQTQQAIPSPIAGEVIHAGPYGSGGNAVIIRGDNGNLVYLFHMSSIDVRAGQQVGYGQDLGNQGSTGNSTGPHVHIEAKPGTIDRWVNDLLDGRFDGRRN